DRSRSGLDGPLGRDKRDAVAERQAREFRRGDSNSLHGSPARAPPGLGALGRRDLGIRDSGMPEKDYGREAWAERGGSSRGRSASGGGGRSM
ncbi:unnamed protein product, partial [Sphacelaria rigidula]